MSPPPRSSSPRRKRLTLRTQTRHTHTNKSGARNRENYGLLRTYCVQERDYSIFLEKYDYYTNNIMFYFTLSLEVDYFTIFRDM